MAAGDVFVYAVRADDTAAIDAILTTKVVVADLMTVHVVNGIAYYTVVKAA